MKSQKNVEEQSIDFIKRDLIPEMVHNRCFCDTNSREFVDLESVTVEPANLSRKFSRSCEIYRVKAVVRFSGEPCTFPLVVKLLPNTNDSGNALDAFQNEEMFYSKMTLKYGAAHAPKCYLADLGRYGRPVIVLEDLEAGGYRKANGKLDEDQLELCVTVLGKIHGRGLRLKAEEYSIFREFYAKLLEVTFTEESLRHFEQRSSRLANVLQLLPDPRLAEKIKKKLGDRPMDIVRNVTSVINDVSTICHGHFSPDNLLFKYQNEKPIDIKVIDWETMRYCSPAIDLGPILFRNTRYASVASKMQEILTLYVDTVKSEYSAINVQRFREDVTDKFLYTCLALSVEENVTDEELLEVLLQLDALGVFN